MHDNPSVRLRQFAAFAAVYVIWGSTYLAIRLAIETLPGFLMSGWRFLTAGTILYLWARWRGAPRPELRYWKSAFIIGGLLLLGGNGSVVWAEQYIPSGLAALLVGTEPLWVVILLWLWPGGERPKPMVVAGLILGFCGAAVLAAPEKGLDGGPFYYMAIAAVLFACLTWASGSLYARRAEMARSPAMATAMQMLAGGLLLLLTGLFLGETKGFDVQAVSTTSWLALAYLTVLGSLVAFSAYSWLVRNTAPTLVATYAYVNPVVAVFLGWLLVDEPVGWRTLFAAVLIVSSVVLVSLAELRPKRRLEAEVVVGSAADPPPIVQQLEKCA